MARFKAPPLARPPVDGQMRGEYGDAVEGVTGPLASRYLARLWFGSTKVEKIPLEVYSMLGHVQIWCDKGHLVKAEGLSKRGKAGMAQLNAMIERGITVEGLLKSGGDAAQIIKLRDEVKEISIAKASMRRNVWKAAHRLAATCWHGYDPIEIGGVPMAGDDIEHLTDSIIMVREVARWWGQLTDYARVAIGWECLHTIRWQLDSEAWPIARWLSLYATWDWRGRAHGYALRPERGKTKRSCFDVLGEEWMQPGSALVRRAEMRAAKPHPLHPPGRPPRPWVRGTPPLVLEPV